MPTYVISLADYMPSPRFDGTSWVTARIKESATETGLFSVIDSFSLPEETDPRNPTSRSFTSTNAQFPTGWYSVEYVDEEGNLEETQPVTSAAPTIEIPEVDEIADLMYARTVTGGGREQGRFTDSTTPDVARVKRYIDRAWKHVDSLTGQEVSSDLTEDFKNVISYYTGMLIEIGSQSMNAERYKELKALYDTGIAALIEATGGTGSSAADEKAFMQAQEKEALYEFPPPFIGLRTRW